MTVTNPAIDALPESRRQLVDLIKREGELRAEDVAERLDMTVSGARQNLRALAADGLVAHSSRRRGTGRPAHYFRLTDAAEAFFPRAYGELTNELLDYVGESDPDLVRKIFQRRGRRRFELAKARLAGLDLEEKVAELTKVLDDDGYVATWERDPDAAAQGWLIIEHNCAILTVALRYGNACTSEIQFIRRVLPEANVERIQHMVEGDHVCAYRITPK